MKKLTLISAIILGSFTIFSFIGADKVNDETNISTYKTKFAQGFEDGHCEGWKDEKGQYAICPVAPIAPIPKVGQSSDSYRDGYNTGFKRGIRDARR
jgi:hypothetical protein